MYPWTIFTVSPFETYDGAWTGIGDESGWGSTGSTAESGVAGSFDWIDGVDFTNDELLTATVVGDWAVVSDTVNYDAGKGTVSADEGSKSSESEKSNLSEHDS